MSEYKCEVCGKEVGPMERVCSECIDKYLERSEDKETQTPQEEKNAKE